jgi:hypothetical protein
VPYLYSQKPNTFLFFFLLLFSFGGDERVRTAGLLLARQALSQLSYTPFFFLSFMGLSGLEPEASRLSGVRSNQLSYRPKEKGGYRYFAILHT